MTTQLKLQSVIAFTLLLGSNVTVQASNPINTDTKTTGPYLGQTPPTLTPKPFAPGIVDTDAYLESEVLFLPDMSALSFTRYGEQADSTFYVMQYQNNQWYHKQIPAEQVKTYSEQFSPSVEKLKNIPVFKNIPVVGYTTSSAGTHYFYVLDLKDGSGHMSYSRRINGHYETPIKMSSAINQGKYIAHPFIAPDESYLMWDAEADGANTPDIFISFKQKDGTWGKAINMGDTINTPRYEQRPKVTPDGKYLFYWKGDVKTKADGSRYVEGGPHWVDAKIIDTLRPKT
ncbi:hypothetical protein [Pseudoalteromonas luteoviolacea]|uniref:Dipeptidylpeptidase IV N-terminal domain-containing protein n=1 Tax=Pseudoalteromonas luteoviolacea S4054 TaxID=1129367 RepID=A0A0F6AB38_9GAMM|nr:hypothetical protein [Pseudoalteromonas luteoviolacea]AOT06859.1 hypothetical protein S4054249_02750 [Pseudoalteromonas luteoviolacea]AOT11777.1 hypothetical protein S40542_02750 [Pseudoalteromonas luteoviolacea]AOT16689.1 hypothetical protein S4054_02750 [Pseudoalteromonas luteoviolacea]KKE83353.1 hypothetical protein N479_14520 [Pseudoalteromonas luteoviolacea S4054]KZN74030.1 hypothetical protein N481_09965 [Pseudoalteromonas luteoviolacea S4047-1]